MCGIYGTFHRDRAADGDSLGAMDHAMRHRGPDDSGTLLDGGCGLGMRRLSIIDLDGGKQPIASEDRAVWVVFNGEIYNFRTLRRELQKRGHHFSTSSDTEVIVHLYEDDGERFVDRLRGMFACAIWDRHRQSLLLARDRLGIKPLYYAETRTGFAFASELRSLLAHPDVERELDPSSLSHYLSFGTTPVDRAAVRGVRKLPPGHLMRVVEGRVAFVRRYWDLAVGAAPDSPRTVEDGVEQVRALLRDAVRSHLESDVPVGAFLSGGVDSATVVALMSEAGQRPHTFSIGFSDRDFDELEYARLVAERFDTKHEELVVRPEAWALLDAIVPALDEPFADVSAIPTWLVSRLAAKRVKVVLSGDGGDEVFGGYDHYEQGLRDARRYDHLPSLLRDGLVALSGALPDAAPGKRLLRHAGMSPRLRFVDGEALFPNDMKARLLAPQLAAAIASSGARDDDPIEARARLLDGAPGDALGRLLYLDTMTYLPLDILTKVDRMSMAHSLEVRPPLLDTPLVEAVARMPSSWKLDGAGRKLLLKQAMRGVVPDPILDRPKRGFGVPIRHWFRGPLRRQAEEILFDRRTIHRGWFDPRYVRALLDEHVSGRRDQSLRLWALLVLELWTRAVVEQQRTIIRPMEALRA